MMFESNQAPDSAMKPPVILHIMHDWGGGLDHWVRRYIEADRRVEHLILKPFGTWGAFGKGLTLLRASDSVDPIERWTIQQSIRSTDIHNPEYGEILQEIIVHYQVDYLFVSSLIGHSLDVLRQPISTCLVMHDYYPYCPALNISFDGLCLQCDETKLNDCFQRNKHNRFFLNVETDEWMRLRNRFLYEVVTRCIALVTPSKSLPRNLQRLEPGFEKASFHLIPHAIKALPKLNRAPSKRRMTVLIPGSLARNKGREIFKAAIDDLVGLADVVMLGCGIEAAQVFSVKPGLNIIPSYEPHELSNIVHRIKPDVAVMMPAVPETFSYTLSEMFALGVPVIASCMGSLEDRVEHEKTGLLVKPNADALLAAVNRLQQEPQLLDEMWQQLSEWKGTSIEQMVGEYHRLLGIPYWHEDIERVNKAQDPSETPASKKTAGPIRRLRNRLSATHQSIHDRIITWTRLPRKYRWWLLSLYLSASAIPRHVLRIAAKLRSSN